MARISIIIKTLNESASIARAIESALKATRGLDAEVIVADSLSTDDTVAIAKRYPVKVVQLEDPADRSCGVGAQLGFQHSTSEFVFILDGDMALDEHFFGPGLRALEEDPGLAGVAGQLQEVSQALEYRLRVMQGDPSLQPGLVDRLNSGGLYRRKALEDVGYFTDPNLHSFEEFELGLRLVAKGWRLRRLPEAGVWHKGHEVAPTKLLRQRWNSRYAFGLGELLRATLGRPYFGRAVWQTRLFLLVAGWWFLLAGALVATLADPSRWRWLAVLALTPFVVMIIKKRSVPLGIYAVSAWFVITAGLFAGFFSERRDPQRPIPARVL